MVRLRNGRRGTVVHIYSPRQDLPQAYAVELYPGDGELVTILHDEVVEVVWRVGDDISGREAKTLLETNLLPLRINTKRLNAQKISSVQLDSVNCLYRSGEREGIDMSIRKVLVVLFGISIIVMWAGRNTIYRPSISLGPLPRLFFEITPRYPAGEPVYRGEVRTSPETPPQHSDFARRNIRPLTNLPPLSLAPQPVALQGPASSRTSLIYTMPMYFDTWRKQVVSWFHSPDSGWRMTLAIGNTGTVPLNFTKENVFFALDSAGQNATGSDILGGVVTISPGKVKAIVVISSNPEATSLAIKIGGENIIWPLDDLMANTMLNDVSPVRSDSPLDISPDGATVFSRLPHKITGNGLFKAQALHTVLIENETFGRLQRPEGGLIGFLYIRIANTSDAPMNLTAITAGIVRGSPAADLEITISHEELGRLLGQMTLSATISPGGIASGYIPFLQDHPSHTNFVRLHTSLGLLHVAPVDSFPLR